MSRLFWKIKTHEYSRTVKTTKCFATVTRLRIIYSKVKILKIQNVTTSVLFTFIFVDLGVRSNIEQIVHTTLGRFLVA